MAESDRTEQAARERTVQRLWTVQRSWADHERRKVTAERAARPGVLSQRLPQGNSPNAPYPRVTTRSSTSDATDLSRHWMGTLSYQLRKFHEGG